MIALNEIITKKDLFEQKYKLMGKSFNLNKIVELEKKFIIFDRNSSELRAKCNKLCSEIAEVIDLGVDSKEMIDSINNLDKEIKKMNKKAQNAMARINGLLKKLPNLAIDDNILNIAIKTKQDDLEYSNGKFINEFASDFAFDSTEHSEKQFYKALQKMVFQAEDLPRLILLNTQEKVYKFIFLCDANSAKDIMKNLETILTKNAKHLVLKSIKSLRHYSSKEFLARLPDCSNVLVELLGEYVSRENSIKFYDKNLDMTQFVNMIKITINEK